MEGFLNARLAIDAAIDKVAETAINPRNTYPQGEAAITQCVAEHRERLHQLHAMSEEFLELAMHCQEFVKD